jgi:hypothetical protein
MRNFVTICAVVVASAAVAFTGACGGGSDGEQTEQAKKTETAAEATQEVESLPTDQVPYQSDIEAAGYEVVYYNEFPASAASRNGRLLLYNSATGGKDGGAVFVEQWSTYTQWIWHWYFEDARPKSFRRADINKDGLWDIRIFTANGDEMDLINDDTFALLGQGRHDKIALNGICSEPEKGHPLWHCFDQNPRTTWQSAVAEGQPAFIEVASPFGLSAGILSIVAADKYQPRECKLYADGKMVQSFELPQTTDRQLIQLDSPLNAAKKIRLEILSCHGDEGTVAIAELQIR